MLLISASLQKSGSAWFLNLTNDLMVKAGFSDNRKMRDKFGLTFIKYDECNIQELTFEKLKILTSSPVSDYSFVVKTHHPPNSHILELLSKGKIKITYIYRDPRDVAVSGLEAGKILRDRGVFERFGKLRTMAEAIEWSKKILRDNWAKWRNIEGVLYFKYEDLIMKPLAQLKLLCAFLEIQLEDKVLINIIEKWKSDNLKSHQKKHLHHNVGSIGRYQELMSPEEIELCKEKFGKYLIEMGYS